jgi:transposase-like protein
MHCPHCASVTTKEQTQKTTLGYRTFRCSACKHLFNERTGTPFNFLEYPTDVVLLVVLWRLRYKLSLRDLAEMFLERGLVFTHETVREWEKRFAPLITEQLRAKRRGQARPSWYVDETSIKVHGKWCYLYRAIDATDGHASYPRAVRETLGTMCSIERTHTLIIAWSKTIGESSNGIIRCMVSETSIRLLVSVLPLTNYATISVLALPWENRPHSQNSDEFSLIGLQL